MQIVFGSILAISLLLAINFSGRIAAGRNIEGQRSDLQNTIHTLEARSTRLRSELEHVSSDGFVAQWARREGGMVRPNEMLVVPVPARTTPTPMLLPTVAFTPPPESDAQNWQLWWQLFFDSPPPGGR